MQEKKSPKNSGRPLSFGNAKMGLATCLPCRDDVNSWVDPEKCLMLSIFLLLLRLVGQRGTAATKLKIIDHKLHEKKIDQKFVARRLSLMMQGRHFVRQ